MLNCNVCKTLLQRTLNVSAMSFQHESIFHNVEVTFIILHINVLLIQHLHAVWESLSFRVKILRKNLFKQSYREYLIA